MRARSSENLWAFDLRVFASCVHRHRRLGSDLKEGHAKERRARATRLVVVSLNFRTVAAAELRLKVKRTVLKRLRQPVRKCFSFVNAGAPAQAGVGILGTTAGNLVGAGTLVGGPSMLPMTGGTVLKRDKEVSWIQETTECMAKVAQGMSVGMDKVSKV